MLKDKSAWFSADALLSVDALFPAANTGTELFNTNNNDINPENIEGLLTPFVITGPGIKENFKIEEVLKHVDQYATLAKITKIKHPTKPILDGRIIESIFIKQD